MTAQDTLIRRHTPDQRILLSERTWEQFKLIQKGFENSRGVRLFYFDGTIEILMPGREHEIFRGIIGFLVELFCVEKGIEHESTGSMTQEREGIASVEADESYCFGTSKPTPDLSIEVIFTSGDISKLARYQALSVPEVWFWEDGLLRLYRLRGDRYEQITQSEIPELVNLDLELLTRCVLMTQTSRLEAIKAFRQGISKGVS